ncbi:hypothetical protein SNE40_022702 [Patella caerulea]|uniref:2',5'-phosphodiesterase 12 n=2 Tax=Patella caerulea TaxID=87958 RepID=A0AAN8GFX9_PATCE
MSHIYVKCIPESERLEISVVYDKRTYNMSRLKEEEIGKCFARLQMNIMKIIQKRKNKKKKKSKEATPMEDSDSIISISMLKKGKTLLDTTPNIDAWTEDSELVIGDTKLQMEINSPTVISLSLPASIMSGFPIFPKSELEFVNIDHCKFVWYREPLPSASAKDADNVPVEISRERYYSPTPAEIGHRLSLTLTPLNGERVGKEVSVTSKFEVEAGPGLCPFEKRHLYTQKEAEKESLRVVSYNILADVYADSDFSRTELFPYCPPYALNYDYRKQLLLKEITGYNGDIVCLQECDRRYFESDFKPALDLLGLSGLLKIKGGQVPEGSALFYRRSKLRLLGQHDILLTEVVANEEKYSDLWQKICSLGPLKEKMEARSTALQLAVFESLDVKDKILMVANTHLFFHPKASHIRMLQMAICLRHIESVMSQYISEGKTVSFIFCGDFNSVAEEEINTFMTTKFIPSDYYLWNSSGEEEKLNDLELHHNFNIISGCGYSKYTNYTVGFHGMLDYIFVDSDNLTVTEVIPMPDHEDVITHIALPSIVAPSDHIAQICQIKWK